MSETWLRFPPGVRWAGEKAPVPGWWEHQLRGMPPERRLDPALRAQARELSAILESGPASN